MEKIFFKAGDLVKVKHDLSNVPRMLVKSVDKTTLNVGGDKPGLLGVTCVWFNKEQSLCSYRFNTKDLIHD